MNRRSFVSGLIATVAGLVLPYEPKVIYSFASPRPVPVSVTEYEDFVSKISSGLGVPREYLRGVGPMGTLTTQLELLAARSSRAWPKK